MKKLNCADAGFTCNAIVTANTEEEVMAIAAGHALNVHGTTVTPEMASHIKTLITEEV